MKITNDYKTISFYKFAQSIGAIDINHGNDIDINDLLFKSFIFLHKDIILTKKQEVQYEVFKDRYNYFLQYCIENNIVKKDYFQEVKYLNITTVPDMSKIQIPDLTQELKDMDFDLNKLGEIFGKLSKN